MKGRLDGEDEKMSDEDGGIGFKMHSLGVEMTLETHSIEAAQTTFVCSRLSDLRIAITPLQVHLSRAWKIAWKLSWHHPTFLWPISYYVPP